MKTKDKKIWTVHYSAKPFGAFTSTGSFTSSGPATSAGDAEKRAMTDARKSKLRVLKINKVELVATCDW